MIVSVTFNPAVDKTLFIRRLSLGTVNRVDRSLIDPGGKGINVSRVVHRLGQPTVAFGFLAGDLGAVVTRALDAEGVAHRFAWVGGETRLDVIVVDEATGTSTNLYDRGPEIDAASLERLRADIGRWLPYTRVLIAGGSLPPGVPHDVYAGLLAEAARLGVSTILDADGDTLRQGIAGHPSVIKPNVREAEALVGRRLPDVAAVVVAAREIVAQGVATVIVSMGAEGCICATADRVLLAVPPPIERRSTVGSGDSLVAGLAVALATGRDLIAGLRLGTAAGAATAMTEGTELGTREDIERLAADVEVRTLHG